MVGVTKIQRANAGYWLAAVAEGGEDYYTKPGEAPGEWVGALAADLGLSGRVDAESYGAILDGRDPISGDQLIKRPETRYRLRPDGTEKRVEPVLGYDVRFSCPKSVSILYALGDEPTRERVIELVNAAVRDGLAHLEDEACFVQRGEGGKRIERGEGFAGMAFRHRMSRAGDPALHVHVVVPNLTRAASDGKWLALASPQGRSPLWPHGKSAGVVFQAALRAGFLREFGLDFQEVTNGYADLAGFDRDLIEALSTRSKEIADWMEAHGADGVAAAQTAAYRTRDKKDYGVDEDPRRSEWIAAAQPYGVTPQTISETMAGGRPRHPAEITDAHLDAAITDLEERSSHFDRRALLWSLCDQLSEGAEHPEIVAAVDRLLASERIVCIYEADGPLDFDQYTTPRIVALEQRFIDTALGERDAGAAVADTSLVAAVLDGHSYLGEDQRQLVLRLTTGGERILPVAAWPGTGKTTALEAARQIWKETGYPVIGCATARTASGELRAAGIADATSIASLLRRAEQRRRRGLAPLPPGTVIVLDEASTTSTPDLEELRFLAIECDGKLVMVGDPRQIGAIGPGGLFGTVTLRVEPQTLTTIRRQSRSEDRRVVTLIHEGRGSEALDLLRTQSRLVIGDDLPETLDAMLLDWHRDFAGGADAVMIARRNRDVDALNDRARELLRETNALGDAEVIVGERPFAAGDRVQTRINAEGVANRERWEIIGVHPGERSIALRRLGGEEHVVTLGPSYLDRHRINDNGPALEHAYALTKFGAQGKTVDRAYPLLDGDAGLEQELVAVSRGREIANVYVVASSELTDADLGPGRREISDPLHDLRIAIEREGNDHAAIEVGLRKSIAALPADRLARRRAELQAAVRAADPLLSRRERLERTIDRAEHWLATLSREREAIEAMSSPPADELAAVGDAEARTADDLRRAVAEHDMLDRDEPETRPSNPVDPALRLEASLIEQRVDALVSRQIAADRLDISQLTHSTLGAYPHDESDRVLAWHQGARALYEYRVRHGISDEAEPFGARQPCGASARAERARAERRLAQAQRRLNRAPDRGTQRDAGHVTERSAERILRIRR